MNKITHSIAQHQRAEALQTKFGRRIAAALTGHDAERPRRDIEERLRIAREQALSRARAARRTVAAPATVTLGGGTLAMGSPGAEATPWWLRLSALLPLVVLLAGLFLIDHFYTQAQIEAAAEVDAAILADDLPPDAYRDPGFVEFLKSGRR